jgi:hypothetical protein
MTAFVLRLTDESSGLTSAMRLHDPGDRALPLGRLLDLRFRGWDGSDRSVSVLPEHGHGLRCLQDLVYRLGLGPGRVWPGVQFLQDDLPVDMGVGAVVRRAVAGDVEFDLVDVTLDRSGPGYGRDWVSFHARRWGLAGGEYDDFVAGALEAAGLDDRALGVDAPDNRLELVLALATRVSGSDFENYSRFVDGGLRFRTGDQAVLNMAAGYGGVCVEKVQALKFLTDHYGLESEYLLAGPSGGRLPVDRLRELLYTLDFRFAKRHMRYWQHLALLYWLDGEPLVVDATGGCLPFVFRPGDAGRRLLDSGEPVRVRMVGEPEDYYYHRVAQDVPLDLLLALECRLEGADLVQVFENELGLYVSDRYYVMPLPYRTGAEYLRLRGEYEQYCGRLGLRGEVGADWALNGAIGRRFAADCPAVAAMVLDCRDRLLERYDDWLEAEHDAGLVVIDLLSSGGR